MKNILMSLALLGTFAAMSAKGDSYLYWMVDTTDSASVFNADTAVLIATRGGGNDHILGAAALSNGDSVRLASDSVAAYRGDAWSFYVELYNGESWVGQSTSAEFVTYKAAYDAGAIYKSLDPNGLAQVTFMGFTNVPEPTSGVLMLLGLCGLALKRKRA